MNFNAIIDSFLADIVGFRLGTYRRVHRSAGVMSFALLLFHVLVVAFQRTSFSLRIRHCLSHCRCIINYALSNPSWQRQLSIRRHGLPQPLFITGLTSGKTKGLHWPLRPYRQLLHVRRERHLVPSSLLYHKLVRLKLLMSRFAQYYQRTKNAIHAIQALAIFVAWALTIAILTKSGTLGGRVWYNFALVSLSMAYSSWIEELMPPQCWCCIPALIYQAAFPVFQRLRRFSNAYAHALIDVVYTIFWLAAFACLITWVKQGSHAAKDWKSKVNLCDKFAWGPVSKCKLGRDTWILGVIIW